MNIFEQYLEKIKKILLNLSKEGDLILPDSMDGITTEIPPSKFNSDISTNVAMVLSKINKKSPIDLLAKKNVKEIYMWSRKNLEKKSVNKTTTWLRIKDNKIRNIITKEIR